MRKAGTPAFILLSDSHRIEHWFFMGHGKEFAAYYYNRGHEWGKDVVINYKHDAFQFECTGSGNPHRIAGCNKNIC